jgi:hypothetical protein
MDDKNKIKFLENTISRFDSYIISTNSKISVIIAFNAVLIGTTLFKFDELLKLFTKCLCFQYFAIFVIFLIILFSAISMLFAFRSVSPFLESGEKEGVYTSLKFFNSIVKMKREDYIERIRKLSDEEVISDLGQQSYVLAKGLSLKMKYLKISTIFIFLNILLLIILMLLKLFSIL